MEPKNLENQVVKTDTMKEEKSTSNQIDLRAGMTTGSRKQATGLLTVRDDEILERS